MEWYNWIINNKELIKIIYGLLITTICLVIVSKAHKFYHLSDHEGLRYFRNTFLFFGVAFIVRYIFGSLAIFQLINPDYYVIISLLFEYFILMAGFFLIYSLLWKKLDGEKGNYSSILNLRISIFYLMAFIITMVDYLWKGYYFMFISQSAIFIIAAIISYINYYKKGKKGKFLRYYFIAILLMFVTGVLNTISAMYLNWNIGVLIFIYLLNITIFILLLYGIIKITKKPSEKTIWERKEKDLK